MKNARRCFLQIKQLTDQNVASLQWIIFLLLRQLNLLCWVIKNLKH